MVSGRDKNWIIKRDATAPASKPESRDGLAPLVEELLDARSASSMSERLDFIRPKSFSDLSDFRRLPDMDRAVREILQSLDAGLSVCIYGDYDADGMTSTVLLLKALAALGAEADYYIPHRINEGYGLNEEAIRLINAKGAKLLITVDCGVSDADEVALATRLGTRVVITDHHKPPADPASLPEAVAIINTELMDEPGPSMGMSGAGVAFALALCLLEDRGFERDCPLTRELAQLAAIGTVADGVPMLGDNRVITALGLRGMAGAPVPGIRAMMAVASVEAASLNEDSVSFALAPRLNAVGRLDDPALGVKLLLAKDPKEAGELALKFEALNKKRQDIDSAIFQEITSALDARADTMDKPILVLRGVNWHLGVIGITAARLMEKYNKPVILVSFDREPQSAGQTTDPDKGSDVVDISDLGNISDVGNVSDAGNITDMGIISDAGDISDVGTISDVGKGSGRSLAGFDLHSALSQAASLLEAYGGHELACGLTIKESNFIAFRTLMEDIAAERYDPGDTRAREALTADLMVSYNQLGLEAIEGLERLAPFGNQNPRPIFAIMNMRLTDHKPIGQGNRHFRLFFAPMVNETSLAGEFVVIAFSMEDIAEFPRLGEIYDVLIQAEINIWQGRRSPRYALKDIRVSALYRGAGICPGGSAEAAAGVSAGWSADSGAEAAAGVSAGESVGPGTGESVGSSAAINPGENVGAGVDTVSGMDSSGNWDKYKDAILGGRDFREKQLEALDALAGGANTLLLMATGRGKTAVFQTAIAAAGGQKVSIVIYPLRSLARDQLIRMRKTLAPFGLNTELAWGGLDHWEKKAFFNNLYNGRIHLVITTAEFLQAHLPKFGVIADRIGLFVVDEAHHIADKHRQAYKDLRTVWAKLGKPLLMATTATADDARAGSIIRDFFIRRLVIEDHRRENLEIVDARNGGREQKLSYLLSLIRDEGKMIIYVNSRALTEELSASLRDSLPWMKGLINFYHGGLLPDIRQEREKAFLSGDCRVLVSTSAFGEGADIPDIRDVVLYHLCFSKAEFNQLSGRAGRDGLTARIHLLYDKEDQDLNMLLLSEQAPDRDTLGGFYLLLKEAAAASNPIDMTDQRLTEEMRHRGYSGFSERTAEYCLGVLEELNLLLRERDGDARVIHFAPPPPAKLNLAQSSFYMEGQRNIDLFHEYTGLAFSPDLSSLLAGINRPILPEKPRI